jgi:glycosyltransferase involved in cell wall biosynthesis/tetratricopeptide (TPR) repeat protein
MKSIGLCMIVRNEAAVIRRCLESMLPLIDYVLIVDTGSTDSTRAIVRDFLSEKNIPGEVVDEPWQNFAYNRTFALRKLREKRQIDYSLMVDADQIMVYESGFAAQRFKETLREDLYDIRLRTGSIEYLVPHLSSNRVDIAYKGVLHEYRECPDHCTRGIASGFTIQEMQDSARSTNVRKFQDDAETLLHALRNESDPFLVSRYTFYLAQSYRDFGDSESALKYYLERAELGFWDQEIFLSLYNAAQMKEALKRPETEIIETYLRAHQTCPYRAEALYGAARFCRSVGRYDQGYALAKQVLHLRPPLQGAFVEAWIYQYGVRDELSVLAYWIGNYAESLDLCLALLADGQVPEDQHARIRQNAHFSVDRINPLTLASNHQRAGQAPTIDDTRLPSFHHKQMAARRAAAASRYAIVTPYFRETRGKLERCLRSVGRQTVAVDHIVVADGFAQQWIDGEPVRHLRLDVSHDGLGALLAASEGYGGIGFLDADNWIADDHVERCVEAASEVGPDCDYVIARRFLTRPDGTTIDVKNPHLSEDVDTNCLFFLEGSYHSLHHWVTIPRQLSAINDRVVVSALKNYGLRPARVKEPTVFYECLWSTIYQSVGEVPPPNAKPNVDPMPIYAWLDTLPDRELTIANRRSGLTVRRQSRIFTSSGPGVVTPPVGRNSPCPCGSGKKYKHCHGHIASR